MSEYQYYEFQAIDRALTRGEMDELRRYSSRARITPASFVNDYSWGSFKGDEDAWMERYFDAFLYLANWGTHILTLRLPAAALAPAEAKEFATGDSLSAKATRDKVILSFHSEDEEGDEWTEGEGLLASLVPVRAELARGDRRALYLGWLLGAQNGELSDDEEEPPVPPGLGHLSASLEALADFLRIDRDLLGIAAQASAPAAASKPSRREGMAWLAQVPGAEKDSLLARLLEGEEAGVVGAELARRFRHDRRPGSTVAPARRRTVGELLQTAEGQAERRREAAVRKAAAEKERRDREAAAAREKHLDSLVGKEAKLWTEVEALVASRLQKSYNAAVRLLVDLRDLAARSGSGDFRRRLDRLRAAHARKPTLIERFSKAGL